MKFSYQWIQTHIEEPLPSPKEIEEKIIFHAFEIESVESVGDDTVFDIKVLPDRAGDCFSHRGMAREIAGLFGLTLKEVTHEPLIQKGTFSVELAHGVCDRYIAVRIDGVTVRPSSDSMKKKLEAIGQRSINAIVDVTNFILFDTGQPIHVFDAANIDGGIVVRPAHEGETIKLLGGEEKTLNESDTVIADFLGPLALAGVKGGSSAEVTSGTTSILLEVAHFDPVAVRKTSRRLNLITDASRRFEAGVAPSRAFDVASYACSLLCQVAGGVVSAVVDTDNTVPFDRTISFSLSDITRVLGPWVSSADIRSVFDRFHYSYKETGETFILTVPPWRSDLVGPHDIAEEIGRVCGYDAIAPQPLPFTPSVERNDTDQKIVAVKAWCIAQGFREVMTYTFRPKGEVALSYGAKGKDKLRSNLSDGLKESYELNRLNAPLVGIKEIKLFEIGTVFFSDREEMHVALCDKGTIQELPLDQFMQEKGIVLKDDTTLPSFDQKKITPFVPWSPYPFIVRDGSVWIEGIDRSVLTGILDEFAVQHKRPWYFFDEFQKDGKTSLAFRFIFQENDRTLTDDEVTKEFQTLITTLEKTEGITLR